MGLFDNCILASDVDGTLVVDGYINPKNIEKIEYFMSEGGAFSIATGRSAGAALIIAKDLKSLSPSIVANGGMIYDYKNKEVLYQAVIPKEEHFIVNEIYNRFPTVGIEVHAGEKVFTVRQTRATDMHQEYEELETLVVTFLEASKYDWNIVNFLLPDKETFNKLKEFTSTLDVTSKFIDTCANFGGMIHLYHELIIGGISKAATLMRLADMLNIKKGSIFAIGDYYNDLDMLKLADISAVPIDSPEDIKVEASYLTVPCREGAVADFIDYLTAKFSK